MHLAARRIASPIEESTGSADAGIKGGKISEKWRVFVCGEEGGRVKQRAGWVAGLDFYPLRFSVFGTEL